MMMTPALRRFTLTAHLTSSLGWAGAVIAFLALAAIGVTSDDEPTVRGVYLVMAPAAWFVLVPLAHASLFSGIALSLGTPWGLFRHYWVVLKLVITVLSTIILLIYMGTFRQMAGVAADPVVDLSVVRNGSPLLHAILALILLLVATVLGVYKPLGMTAYGRRQQDEHRQELSRTEWARSRARVPDRIRTTPRWVYFSVVFAIGVILMLVILHLAGGGPGGH